MDMDIDIVNISNLHLFVEISPNHLHWLYMIVSYTSILLSHSYKIKGFNLTLWVGLGIPLKSIYTQWMAYIRPYSLHI